MLSMDAALARLMGAARPVAEVETLAADLSLGRVLAQELSYNFV